jgi:hypothetical protein
MNPIPSLSPHEFYQMHKSRQTLTGSSSVLWLKSQRHVSESNVAEAFECLTLTCVSLE